MKLKFILGRNVKIYRFRMNYTQEQLAEKLNVSTNYIGRLERGQHSPSLDKIERISSTLNIQPYELFITHDEGDKLPSRVNLVNTKK